MLLFPPRYVSSLCDAMQRHHTCISFLAKLASSPSAAIALLRGRWEKVSVLAVRFGCVYRGLPLASQRVFPARHKLQVGWVDAYPVIADEMVELWNVFTDALRYRSDKPRVHHSMNRRPDIENGCLCVPLRIQPSSPLPAAFGFVHSDFGEESPKVFSLKMRDGEILEISHARASSGAVREWSGPRWCTSTVPARLFYLDAMVMS